ncbi:MAG: arylamine N-acetyltransferase [Terriglobia bacterium]|nr:arylamine N-acetyltransferase [Terriglobia bacterium]
MNVDAYLRRIGLNERPPATLAGLTAVHRAHLLAIPYENVDVQLRRPVTIERPAIYEKIVERGRGGWCYEMNGMLGWALGELGFNVTRATGSVMREMSGDAANANHLVLRVELPEGIYLADVGFGDGPRDPIKVATGAFRSGGFDFSLRRADDRWWRLHSHPFGAASSFDFNLAPASETELAAKCAQLQDDPQSHFRLNLFCFRHTENGITSLRGRVLRKVTRKGFRDRIIEDADDLLSVLKSELSLDVPEAAALWPAIVARHDEVMAQRTV